MKVTFIIPSKGRPTLANTVASLYAQSNPNWNAVVCFDGVEPTMQSNAKIQVVHSPLKLGIGVNGAGAVRNYAIQRAIETFHLGDWIGFVDDDDTLVPTYVSDLESHVGNMYNPQPYGAVVFKMLYTDGTKLPPNGITDINQLENKIGISFSIRKDVYTLAKFEPSSGEDFHFLKKVQDAGVKIYFSEFVNYFVSPLGCAPDRRPQ